MLSDPIPATAQPPRQFSPLPQVAVELLEEFFGSLETQGKEFPNPLNNPTKEVECPSCPVKPIARPNGKQMIKMDQPPPANETINLDETITLEEDSIQLLPTPRKKSPGNKRKGSNPRRAPVKEKLVTGIRLCKGCRVAIAIEPNKKLTITLCSKCKFCTCD